MYFQISNTIINATADHNWITWTTKESGSPSCFFVEIYSSEFLICSIVFPSCHETSLHSVVFVPQLFLFALVYNSSVSVPDSLLLSCSRDKESQNIFPCNLPLHKPFYSSAQTEICFPVYYACVVPDMLAFLALGGLYVRL